MKKMTALLLALCLLLAAVPALGEEAGPGGNWYMSLAEVTLGYILLNEDGTAVVNIASQEDMTGTWTADGDTVTVTIDGSSLDFAYDGATLKSDMFPLDLTREEGKLPMNLISKMMSGEEYELPEGMTDVELMSIAMNFVAEYTKIVQASSGDDGTGAAQPTAAPENPVVTIVQSSYRTLKKYKGYCGVYIARIRNDNDFPLYVTGGTMKLSDADGNLLSESKYLYTCGSKYLEPGEISFVSLQADLEEDPGDVAYEVGIETKQKAYYNTDTALKVENPVLQKGDGYEGDTLRATIINDTDQPLPGLSVIFALMDADGNLLQVTTEGLYRHELGPNSVITMVSSIDSKVSDFCEANGIEPAIVEAYAWAENK